MKRLTIVLVIAAGSFGCNVSVGPTTSTSKASTTATTPPAVKHSAFIETFSPDQLLKRAYPAAHPSVGVLGSTRSADATGEKPFRFDRDFHLVFGTESTGKDEFDEIAFLKAFQDEINTAIRNTGAKSTGRAGCCGTGGTYDFLQEFTEWYQDGRFHGNLQVVGRPISENRYLVRITITEYEFEL